MDPQEVLSQNKATSEHVEDSPVLNTGTEAAETDEGPANPTWKIFLALCALCLSFGSQLGVGSNMTPSVLGPIAAEFNATSIQGWISSGWLMSTCVAFVLAGRLSDIFGRRWIITGSNILAIGGFAICAFTSNFSAFIGGIIILGFAGGLAQTATAAACEIVPNKYRPMAIAFLELGIAPTGYLSGSTFAHLIIAHTTYKWIFRLGILLCGVAFLMCLAFYHPPAPPKHNGKSSWSLFVQLDFVGIVLFSGGLGVFLMGVIWAGGQYDAKDAHVIGPIVGGLVALAFFVGWEIYMADRAIVPPHLFRGKTRIFTLPIICHFVTGTVFFSQIALWPQQSSLFYAKNTIEVGLLGLPLGVAVFVGGCVIGPFIPKLGPTNRQLLVWITAQVIATACMSALTPQSRTAGIALQVLAGLPFHVIVNLCFLTTAFSQDDEDIGVAIGLCGASRSLGGTVAVSIYLTILGSEIPKKVPAAIISSVAQYNLPSSTLSALIPALLSGDTETANSLPGITTQIFNLAVEGMKRGYSDSFKIVYLSTLGFGVCGILAAVFVTDVSSSFTSRTAVRLELETDAQVERRDDLKADV